MSVKINNLTFPYSYFRRLGRNKGSFILFGYIILKIILSPRTCVEPRLEFSSENELLINYREQTIAISKKSDQGLPCVNTVEALYLVSAILAMARFRDKTENL